MDCGHPGPAALQTRQPLALVFRDSSVFWCLGRSAAARYSGQHPRSKFRFCTRFERVLFAATQWRAMARAETQAMPRVSGRQIIRLSTRRFLPRGLGVINPGDGSRHARLPCIACNRKKFGRSCCFYSRFSADGWPSCSERMLFLRGDSIVRQRHASRSGRRVKPGPGMRTPRLVMTTDHCNWPADWRSFSVGGKVCGRLHWLARQDL